MDTLLQQLINGVTLGMMYALLALGFTMVYGIMGLINFAHFNIFMVGAFIGLLILQALGVHDGGAYGAPAIVAIALAVVGFVAQWRTTQEYTLAWSQSQFQSGSSTV